MAIMPRPDSTAIPHPASRIDGCPNCVHNTEAPKSWLGTDADVTCAYLCSDCGHAWITSWKAA